MNNCETYEFVYFNSEREGFQFSFQTQQMLSGLKQSDKSCDLWYFSYIFKKKLHISLIKASFSRSKALHSTVCWTPKGKRGFFDQLCPKILPTHKNQKNNFRSGLRYTVKGLHHPPFAFFTEQEVDSVSRQQSHGNHLWIGASSVFGWCNPFAVYAWVQAMTKEQQICSVGSKSFQTSFNDFNFFLLCFGLILKSYILLILGPPAVTCTIHYVN